MDQRDRNRAIGALLALALSFATSCYDEQAGGRDTDADLADTEGMTEATATLPTEGTTTPGTTGPDTGDTDALPDPGVEAARMLFDPIVRAQCEHAFACCTDDELARDLGPSIADADDCTDRVLDMMEAGVSVTVGGYGLYLPNFLVFFAYGLNGDRVEVDEAGFAACVAELQALDCAPAPTEADRCVSPEVAPTDACQPSNLFVGAQGVGDDCTVYSGLECADGLACQVYGAEAGVCVEALTVGDPCFEDYHCAGDLICDFTSGTCAEAGSFGDPCAYADADNPVPEVLETRCSPGLVCDPIDGVCRARGCSFGDYCGGIDAQCPQGLNCVAGVCDVLAEIGERCWDDDDCAAGVCESGDQGARCRPQGDIGDPCASHRLCTSGYCDPSSQQCAATIAPDQPCDAAAPDEQCADGYCAGTNCVAFPALGEACPDYTCNWREGHQCHEGICEAFPYDNGTSCVADYECASGNCVGECAPRVAIGQPCVVASDQCVAQAYCEADDGELQGQCVARLEGGALCESDAQCWASCDVYHGQRRCSGLPPGQLACDGG